MKTLKLNNGIEMPILGYGVYLVEPDECERCVSDAISAGYRLIDTAQAYYNEDGVGNAITKCGVPRNELFITTKMWIYTNPEDARKSIEQSLRKLRTDYIDLLLVHQPIGDYYGTYRVMEEAYKLGKVRAIGLSNFYPDRFVDLAENMEIKPAINQLRTNVFSQQWEAVKEMSPYGTRLMAWAPLAQSSDDLLSNDTLKDLASAHGKTVMQVALRYLLQRGIIAIPKTTHRNRMEENLQVFDFALSDTEMEAIKPLDKESDFRFSHRNPELIRFLLEYDKNNNSINKESR